MRRAHSHPQEGNSLPPFPPFPCIDLCGNGGKEDRVLTPALLCRRPCFSSTRTPSSVCWPTPAHSRRMPCCAPPTLWPRYARPPSSTCRPSPTHSAPSRTCLTFPRLPSASGALPGLRHPAWVETALQCGTRSPLRAVLTHMLVQAGQAARDHLRAHLCAMFYFIFCTLDKLK